MALYHSFTHAHTQMYKYASQHTLTHSNWAGILFPCSHNLVFAFVFVFVYVTSFFVLIFAFFLNSNWFFIHFLFIEFRLVTSRCTCVCTFARMFSFSLNLIVDVICMPVSMMLNSSSVTSVCLQQQQQKQIKKECESKANTFKNLKYESVQCWIVQIQYHLNFCFVVWMYSNTLVSIVCQK